MEIIGFFVILILFCEFLIFQNIFVILCWILGMDVEFFLIFLVIDIVCVYNLVMDVIVNFIVQEIKCEFFIF